MQVDISKSLAGVIPVRKFTDRNKAIARIWKAIQSLVPASAPLPAPTSATVKPRKKKKAKSTDKPAVARDGRKKARILELLKQPDGARLAELMVATKRQACCALAYRTWKSIAVTCVGSDRGYPLSDPAMPLCANMSETQKS